MKIVETDNFGGDYPDESFLNLPSLSHEIAEAICDLINKEFSRFGNDYHRFWKTVEEDYKLQPGFEP